MKTHQNPFRDTTLDVDKDYALWKEDQLDVLTQLRGTQVWILFSGGKDSSLALNFLNTASKEFEFAFEVHAGVFPKHRYTASEISTIDGFWEENLNPWDVCAGILIVEEAGGRVTDFKNQLIDIHSNQFLATNGQVTQGMINILKKNELNSI